MKIKKVLRLIWSILSSSFQSTADSFGRVLDLMFHDTDMDLVQPEYYKIMADPADREVYLKAIRERHTGKLVLPSGTVIWIGEYFG